MKLPALWIAAAFAAGILIADQFAPSPKLWLTVTVAAIALGALLAWRARLTAAWSVALVAWIALGGLGASLERIAVPANHVTRLLAAGQIDTTEPLRWQGRLREDPLRLPWASASKSISKASRLRARSFRSPAACAPIFIPAHAPRLLRRAFAPATASKRSYVRGRRAISSIRAQPTFAVISRARKSMSSARSAAENCSA
jgi:hypothetical protein